MTELLTITVEARTAEEAMEQARKWAHAEPHIRLVRITRVRPATIVTANKPEQKWSVELAYVAVADDQLEAGL